LGDIKLEGEKPLGGLNPNSPHFDSIGKEFFQLLLDHIGLLPNHWILDIGCGTGRLAKQLVPFLDQGHYHGVDVNKKFIDLCVEAYQGNFTHVDDYHPEFNPHGVTDFKAYESIGIKRKFDRIIAIALFNHLDVPTIGHWLKLSAKFLKKGGTIFATCFLINEQNFGMVGEFTKKRGPPFQFKWEDGCGEQYYDYRDRPFFNVATREDVMRRAFLAAGLTIREPIFYGNWCKGHRPITGHDVIIADLK